MRKYNQTQATSSPSEHLIGVLLKFISNLEMPYSPIKSELQTASAETVLESEARM